MSERCIKPNTPRMNTRKNSRDSSICWRCQKELNIRVKRPVLIKFLFFWLPLKAYYCPNCITKRYVIRLKNDERD